MVTNGLALIPVFRSDMLVTICIIIFVDLFFEEVYRLCDGLYDKGLDILVCFGCVAGNLYDAELYVRLTFNFGTALGVPDILCQSCAGNELYYVDGTDMGCSSCT